MERRMTATEARIHFGRGDAAVVELGEQVIVERDGRPQIVMLSIAEFERMKGGIPRKTGNSSWKRSWHWALKSSPGGAVSHLSRRQRSSSARCERSEVLSSPICLDANLVVRLIASSERESAVVRLWRDWHEEGRPIVAPTLLPYEVSNALHRYVVHGVYLPERRRNSST
jgi:prevent-host-death family protein